MGNEQAGTFDKQRFSSALRMSKSRLGIHRNKKVNATNAKKKEILGHLDSGNEAMALIHVETLINDERFLPCMDILCMMCDQVLERLPLLVKMKDMPPDMIITFHTLVYSAYRSNCDELIQVRGQIEKRFGKEFVKASDSDLSNLNDVIKNNINMIMPEMGLKIKRLIELANESNVDYHPSETNMRYYNIYMDQLAGEIDRIGGKGGPPIPEPMGAQGPPGYPPPGYGQPPPPQPPYGGGYGGGPGGQGGVNQPYNPHLMVAPPPPQPMYRPPAGPPGYAQGPPGQPPVAPNMPPYMNKEQHVGQHHVQPPPPPPAYPPQGPPAGYPPQPPAQPTVYHGDPVQPPTQAPYYHTKPPGEEMEGLAPVEDVGRGGVPPPMPPPMPPAQPYNGIL